MQMSAWKAPLELPPLASSVSFAGLKTWKNDGTKWIKMVGVWSYDHMYGRVC